MPLIMTMRHIEGESGVGSFLNDTDKTKAGLARNLVVAAKAWRDAYGEIALPFQVVPTQETHSPRIDLLQGTYELLTKVRQPSEKEKGALGSVGYIFLPIEARTLAQVVSENPSYFFFGESNYINSFRKPDLRKYIPPVMEVGFNPSQLFVPDSFAKSQSRQIEMADKFSQNTVETEFPDAKVLMLPASVLAQADMAYFRKTGKVLFANRFARALDQTNEFHVAHIGRHDPAHQLCVYGWDADFGDDGVGAALSVVFLQK